MVCRSEDQVRHHPSAGFSIFFLNALPHCRRAEKAFPTDSFDQGVFLSTVAVHCPPSSAPKINESVNQPASEGSTVASQELVGDAVAQMPWEETLLFKIRKMFSHNSLLSQVKVSCLYHPFSPVLECSLLLTSQFLPSPYHSAPNPSWLLPRSPASVPPLFPQPIGPQI